MLALVLGVAWHDPGMVRGVRHAVFDQAQRWSPRVYEEAPVLIVDIDEESLRRLGQWPWPRTRVAELVSRLQRAGAASVGLDVVFAEADRTSPRQLLKSIRLPREAAAALAALPDHDELLAEVLRAGPVALGFALDGADAAAGTSAAGHKDAVDDDAATCQSPAGFVTLGGAPDAQLRAFAGCVQSIPVLTRAAQGHGALSFIPDEDGVLRRLPLLFDLQGRLVPSLAAETLRLAVNAPRYTVQAAADNGGVIGLIVGKLRIPTTAEAGMWVHYTLPRAERYVPAWKVLAGEVPAKRLQGQMVLVGTSAQGLLDLRFSPLGGIIPGVEVHAQALEQITTGHWLQRPGWAPAVELMAVALGGLLVAIAAMRCGALVSAAAFAALATTLLGGAWLAFTRHGLLLDTMLPTLGMLAVFLPTTVVRHVMSDRQQRWVRHAFARYVSPNLVDYLIDQPQALELGGRRQRCSFVFTDLAGFTSVMERMDPAQAVTVLNQYLDGMIAIAFAHEGTLDRIVGDAVAIVFSAPVQQADHEQRAVNCALAMHRFAQDYLAARRAEGVEFCETRIGVHTGEVIVGNFGGNTIFDYRALGDPVNTASRLEGANKYLGTRVCLSQATLDGCPDLPVRPVGRLRVAGRQEPIMVYEPMAATDGQAVQQEAYAQAYAAMTAGNSAAVGSFQRLHEDSPGDRLVQLHMARLKSGSTDNVIELSSK
ncbi:CHASE2 domain-containing protein [Aquincola tertiaricarbonis]|uniref:CHASE2 domain-containing protein n=1 Tax=Aquincola tertiaricarbonis TaxID=391953 RepID=UPI001E5D91D3|nr:adenylate/guanylate cyclase domain-containing protein [Aquincola tertiaricarbonis]